MSSFGTERLLKVGSISSDINSTRFDFAVTRDRRSARYSERRFERRALQLRDSFLNRRGAFGAGCRRFVFGGVLRGFGARFTLRRRKTGARRGHGNGLRFVFEIDELRIERRRR